MSPEGRDRLNGRQLGALALTAARVPIYEHCVRVSWLWVLLGSLGAAALLSALTSRLNRSAEPRAAGAGAIALELPAGLLLPALALGAAWEGTKAFPETEGRILAAALLLALGLWAACQGPAAAGRCGGILVWITGALCGAVLLFSLPQLRLSRLSPAGSPLESLGVLGRMLLPGAIILIKVKPPNLRVPHWPWWLSALEATAAALVTGGILSPALAAEPGAFRTLARGVSVLGVIRRFEALVNAALLMNAFCLCALLLAAAGALLAGKGPKISEGARPKKFFEKSEKRS